MTHSGKYFKNFKKQKANFDKIPTGRSSVYCLGAIAGAFWQAASGSISGLSEATAD